MMENRRTYRLNVSFNVPSKKLCVDKRAVARRVFAIGGRDNND
jgi:hypothetical protein